MKGPSILEAATLNEAAYMDQNLGAVAGWQLINHNEELGVSQWQSEEGFTYIGIAGTRRQRNDVMDSIRVFLGQTPKNRIEGVIAFMKEHCEDGLANDSIAIGGHSLGGLVASSVAAHFHIPALIQNSPGYFRDAPDPKRSDRIVEVRTARDVVADWGSHVEHVITLQAPEVSTWNIPLLHAIDRQNDLLKKQMPHLASASLVGFHETPGIDKSPDVNPTGNTFQSIRESWRRLREHEADRQAPEAISRRSSISLR